MPIALIGAQGFPLRSPGTPPYVRVRIRRFDEIMLLLQLGKSQGVEISVRQSVVQVLGGVTPPFGGYLRQSVGPPSPGFSGPEAPNRLFSRSSTASSGVVATGALSIHPRLGRCLESPPGRGSSSTLAGMPSGLPPLSERFGPRCVRSCAGPSPSLPVSS